MTPEPTEGARSARDPAPPPTAPPGKGPSLSLGWEKFKAFVPLIQAMLAAVVAYFLTGQVTLAIQQRQLELSNVKEMRDVVLHLLTTDTSP
jgi:hypothetical protein